jgi:pimeloyl-ACP methyl ester carboxylesterase
VQIPTRRALPAQSAVKDRRQTQPSHPIGPPTASSDSPLSLGERIHGDIAGSKMKTIPDCGHFVQEDALAEGVVKKSGCILRPIPLL